MNWKVELKPTAEKQYHRLDRKTRERIKRALSNLRGEKSSTDIRV